MAQSESAPAGRAPDTADGESRRAWLILGACGCALLLLAACGLGAAIMAPSLARYWSKIAPSLPVTAAALPEMHRDKELHFINLEEIREQFRGDDYAALESYYRQQLATRLDYDSRYNLTQFVLQLSRIDTGTEARLQAWSAASPQAHLPHLLLARWHIEMAWAARGSDWASTVTAGGWQGMRDHLAEAERELRAAYDRNPADPNIGAMGITVAMGQSAGPDTEDDWFARAMAADPYHTWAYQNLMNARFPKWGGTWEAARVMVDEALTKTDSNPQLFVLLPKWHEERIARALDNSSNVRADKRAAMRAAYDEELRDAFAEAAAKYPNEYEIHAPYAFAASTNGERAVAMAEFEQIIPLWERGAAMPMPYSEAYDESVQVHLNKFAWILATSKDDRYFDPERALLYAKKAVAINHDWEWTLDTLACAYAANGMFAEAIAAQREAQQFGNAGFQRHCAVDIEKYQRGEAPRY